MTIDYPLRIRDRRSQEIVIAMLDVALQHGVLRGAEQQLAMKIIKDGLGLLLMRKRLSPDEERRIRARWSQYL